MERVFDKILSYKSNGINKDYLVSPNTIQEFFKDSNKLIIIPDYQRPYSWTRKHVTDLLNDVVKLSQESTSSWFFGPIFTVKQSASDNYTELLDGQQRITTIQILLREITLFKFNENVSFESSEFYKKNFTTVIDTCNHCLIKTRGMGEKIAIFTTEESVKEVFREYIVNFDNSENLSDFKSRKTIFERRLREEKQAGSKTAETIENTINVVRAYLKDHFLNLQERSLDENLAALYNFVEALLTKCWLIEIPMQNHHDSIQIFESMNNRGKSLTLVDKIQYKSIINFSKDKLPLIRKKWKEIYAGLLSLESDGFIKSEEDFFKVFFNSIAGDDITREEDFLAKFSELYLDKGDQRLIDFTEESLQVINFIRVMNTCLDDNNKFINSMHFENKDLERIKALFHLLKRTLNISDNSRFLLFYLIRKVEMNQPNAYTIADWIWGLIKFVFIEEVFENTKSNILRIKTMEIIKSGSSLDDLEKVNEFDVKGNSFLKLILNNDNEECKVILYFHSFVENYEVLTSYASNQYKNSHLEHMVPKAWKANWGKFNYKNQDLLELLDSRVDSVKDFNFELFVREVKSKESLELKDYSTAPRNQEDTIIEFIGNKWVLHAATNIQASNDSFEDKKKKHYSKDVIIKIPTNDHSKVGVNAFTSFDYVKLVDRSIEIASTIAKYFNKNWRDMNS
jgi:uncharacterized protein with ParB-like and HNH nuclease domain